MVSSYFIVFTSVEAILFAFHFSVFVLLFTKRKNAFNGAFHNIFRMILICDIMNYIDLTIIQKVSLIPFLIPTFQTSSIIPATLFNISSYLTVCQFIGHTLLAFNRFTLICVPFKHERIWFRQWYTSAFICLPFLTICWKIHEPAMVLYISEETVILRFLNPIVTSSGFTLSTSIYVVTTSAAAILNIFSFIKLNFYKQTSAAINVNEKSLLSVSFIIFGAQILRASNIVMQLIFASNNSIIAFLQASLPYFNGIYALSGSIRLLFLSSTTRKEYISFFNFGIFVQSSTATTSVPINNNSKMFPSNIT